MALLVDQGVARCQARLERARRFAQFYQYRVPFKPHPGPAGPGRWLPDRYADSRHGLSIRWNQPAAMSCQSGDVPMKFESERVEPNVIGILRKSVSRAGLRPMAPAPMANKDSTDGGPGGRFLHAVALGACRYFPVALTSATNKPYRDHLHLDIGPDRLVQHRLNTRSSDESRPSTQDRVCVFESFCYYIS